MKYLKKMLMVISVASVLVLSGCSESESNEPLNIAALNGPTGIGMVKMMEDEEIKQSGMYAITLYQSPDEIVGKVVSGEVDIACVPSNMGAVLYNKTDGAI
ncbi:MAG: ABC transporter substrate-binding protein, partial [Angelakisella sp.]